MKKKVFYTLIALITAMLASFGTTCYALADTGDANNAELLEKEIEQSLDELLNDDTEELYDELLKDSAGSFTLKEYIIKLSNGNGLDIAEIFNLIWSAISQSLTEVLTGFITIVGLVLLYGLSKSISGGLMSDSVTKIIYYVVYGGILVAYLAMLGGVIKSATDSISTIKTLADVSFPIMITLMTALGGATSATICNQGAIIFGSSIIGIINTIIMPLFFAALVFAILGRLSESIKLDKLTAAVTSIAKWCIGIVFGGFSAIITVVGVSGSGIDSVSIKSAKYAIAGYVPILGGYLSDGFDVVLGSAVVIKNAFGMCSLFMLLVIILVPTIKTIVFMLATKLMAGIAEPVADGRISGMFTSVAKSLEVLISMILGISFCMFVILMIGITTCNGGVL